MVAYAPFAFGSENYSPLEVWGSPCISSVDYTNCSEANIDSQLRFPTALDIDSLGYVYVADAWNDHIQKLDNSGMLVKKWGSPGTADGQFRFPAGLAVDSQSNVYVADFGNSRVQKFTSDGKFITKWGSRGSGDGEFFLPQGIATDFQGYVYVADSGNDLIQKFDSSGLFITKVEPYFYSEGGGNPIFQGPSGVAVNPRNSLVYLSDTWSDSIQIFYPSSQ